MTNHDRIRLRHMLESAKEAQSYIVGSKRANLDRDRQLVHSLVRCIEIVGEAAAKVSQQCRSEIVSIPWLDIVAMRNRLIHAYFEINVDLVWDTVVDDLPPLIAVLEEVVGA
jgi:uncharacterized protein with HEPN domain